MYAEIWIFYSNLILQENTAEAKIPTKTRRDQPISINEVATESRSRNKKLFVKLIPGYDISRTSLKEEIEGLFKRSRDLKLSLRPELPKQQLKEVATKEVWLRLKELFKVESSVTTPL